MIDYTYFCVKISLQMNIDKQKRNEVAILMSNDKYRRKLAKNMKAKREEIGVTQTKLSELTGVSRITINKIETVRGTTPNLDSIFRIAFYLCIEPKELLR